MRRKGLISFRRQMRALSEIERREWNWGSPLQRLSCHVALIGLYPIFKKAKRRLADESHVIDRWCKLQERLIA